MIDFHSHVLPAVDDGSESLAMTLEMLQRSFAQGVRHMVATPHFYADEMVPTDFLRRRQQAFEQIPWDAHSMPRLHLGAEVAYFDNMSRSDAMQQLQIGKTGLLLVEMPFAPWTDRVVEDVCRLQDRQGLTPVLAHVERYRDKNQFKRYWDALLAEGVLFQCNAGAFAKPGVSGWVCKQIKGGHVGLLGSDCHNLEDRAPNMGHAAQVISKKLGQHRLQEIEDFSAQALGLYE